MNAVDIAKDVIKQMRGDNIKPFPGKFLHGNFAGMTEGKRIREEAKCEVCALGSMMLACMGLDPKTKFEATQFYGDGPMASIHNVCCKDALAPFFSVRQLMMIEAAFELYHTSLYPNDRGYARWYEDHVGIEPRERMIAVMENIIANDGVFVP